jgi:mono/diheme cytochrome c family protein
MKVHRIIFAFAVISSAGIFAAAAQTNGGAAAIAAHVPALVPNAPLTTAPVYVPDTSHQNDPLSDKVIAFDAGSKAVDAVEGTDFAHFSFTFTNLTPDIVTVLNVHPSCGCTTAELPPLPWQVAPGTTGEIKLKVNLAGKMGTLFKSVKFTTDQGQRDLMLRINLTPPPAITLTEEQKMAGIVAAKADRMAIFKGDCATCHMKNIEGRQGEELYKNACAICHDAPNRATMVPDLAQLKVPTGTEYWRTWITFGKPGSLMPPWAQSQGGPLTDIQIATLAQYLNAVHPSKVAPAGQ